MRSPTQMVGFAATRFVRNSPASAGPRTRLTEKIWKPNSR